MVGFPIHLAASVTEWAADNAWLLIAAAIVVGGLLIYGFRDLLRFSATRVWAISSVNFAESIRRKVLWIIPLAILGVIIVTQLQKAMDPQDAIRQTIKYSLFATGMLVVIATIILACTNLPREIENRVIFTVVTKPTTRLELVLGKILGFARISATILLIMGLFTWVYLQFRAYNFHQEITSRLESGDVSELERNTLEHYAEPGGLLAARELVRPNRIDFYARMPVPGDDRRWMIAGEQDFLVPFELTAADLTPPGSDTVAPEGVTIVLKGLEYEREKATDAVPEDEQGLEPLAAPKPDEKLPAPRAIVSVLNEDFTLVMPTAAVQGNPIKLPSPGSSDQVEVRIPPDQVGRLFTSGSPDRPSFVLVAVRGASRDTLYSAGAQPVHLKVTGGGGEPRIIEPMRDVRDKIAQPLFRTRLSRFGSPVPGDPSGNGVMGLLSYRDVELSPQSDGQVSFELRSGIERTGDETSVEDVYTRVRVQVRDPNSGSLSEPVEFSTENNRPTFFKIPASAFPGDDFELVVRVLTRGHHLGLRSTSVGLVADTQGFALNLLKSLSILWFLSILVIVVSIFCSTFVSWPIAIVMTSLILLGHWGVEQLGDATKPGIGNLVATELGLKEASASRVVSVTVERLTRMLHLVSAVLPDISHFSAVEDVEEGMAVSLSRMGSALQVLAGFGIPLTVLAYVFLRNKEVAP